MFNNFLHLSLRIIERNKLITFINVFGLSTGIAFCMLIFLFVKEEYSFDRFHQHAHRIYRLELTNTHALEKAQREKKELPKSASGLFSNTLISLPLPLGAALEKQLPEVEASVRINGLNTAVVSNGKDSFKETIHYTDANFFQVFSFQLVYGQKQTALSQLSDIVITKKMALKYFGKENPIGKTLHLTQEYIQKSFVVRAVAEDVPENSSIQFNLLLRIEHLRGYDQYKDKMQGFGANTFLLVSPHASIKPIRSKIQAYVDHHVTDFSEHYRMQEKLPSHLQVMQAGLTALPDTHFDTRVVWPKVNNPLYAYILTALGVLILLVACINYVSLTLTTAASRLREIGIRKVMGASRWQVTSQLWAESQVIIWVAMLLSIGLVYLFLPVFNSFTGKKLHFALWQEPVLVAVLFLITLLVGIAAGGYPAVVLSNFQASKLLKGTRTYRINPSFSNVLLLLQYSLCLFLVCSSLVMYKQMRYISEKELGFDQEQVLIVENFKGWDPTSAQLIDRLRQWASKTPAIVSITAASSTVNKPVIQMGMNINGEQVQINFISADEYYLPTLGIHLLEGRNFSSNSKSDQKGLIINETLAKLLGRDSRGKVNSAMGSPILGVVQDYHYQSLESKIAPLALSYSKDFSYYLIIKMRPGNISPTLKAVEQIWQKLSPDQPFVYTFLDENLNTQYITYRNWTGLVGIATGFALVIASLGLFALSGLSALNRTKEIGIRKVMGASVSSLFLLLNKATFRIALLAFLLAMPFSWYLMQVWLQDFAYRIVLSWDLFLAAGLVGIAIACMAVSYHSIRAALANPVSSLRDE